VWWNTDNAILGLLQALGVLLPAAGLPAWLASRTHTRAWSLLLPVSLVGTVALIAAVPESADVYTWVALIGVPVGAAVALGWAVRGAVPAAAALAPVLLAVTWIWPDAWLGQLAGDVLILLSAVAIGRLLAGGVPLVLLKTGLVAMAVFDAWLVFGGYLEAPNAVLNAAVPAPGLPQLQAGTLGFSSLGYGDFLAAAVLGGIVAAERGPQLRLALALLVALLAWDQLFLVFDILPATIPPAIVLLSWEFARRVKRTGWSAWRRPVSSRRDSSPGT
jgi:hypothetical protein